MKNKITKTILLSLLLATVYGCSQEPVARKDADVVNHDGMADSATTAAADLAKEQEPKKP